MRRFIPFFILLGVFSTVMAQKVANVCGEYTFYVPENVALQEAKLIALERARIAGLIKEFNQTLYETTTLVITNRHTGSTVDFYSFGGSDVRGVWIEDKDVPKYEISYEKEMLVVKVSVCGKAKETRSAGIAIETHVLRNGSEPKFESDYFKTGDDMFLYFRAPVDGYLSVYLLNREDQMVYCLLPYQSSSGGSVPIKQDKEYVFFHPDRKWNEGQQVDELFVTADGPVEWNEVYVVFSPNSFVKPITTITDERTPRELSFKDFSSWLTRCQTKDHDMIVEKRLIKIENKQ